MSRESLEPFKTFIRNNPHLIKEVRNGNWTWQELYEEWYFLGDDDERWHIDERPEEEHGGFLGILTKMKNVNLEKIQENIVEMKGLISTIQELISDVKPEGEKPQDRPFEPYTHHDYHPGKYHSSYANSMYKYD